jgi:twitching motility protein PilT
MTQARARDAPDLILVAGVAPCLYLHGRMIRLDGQVLEPQQIVEMLAPFMSPEHTRRLEEIGDVDFAVGRPGIGRVRVNVHRQRASVAAAIRFIREDIPSFAALSLPDKLIEFARLPRGLVLVTGSTGSGKSTTLAAMIEYMNASFERHVITLEDPIEYVFAHRKCVIEQREIGEDSPSFAQALRHVVRQKPDVILVGEMRDRETIATALTASETGHLVLGTLHTNSSAQTIERVIDVFDAAHQPQIRVQLAMTLRSVICQSLLERKDRQGVVPAIEILVMTPAISRAIRDGETHLIPGMIETGKKYGMCLLDQSLADLVQAGAISMETAIARCNDADKMERAFAGAPAQAARSEPKSDPVAAGAGPPGAKKPWH